ncbi:hypothetical protein RHSIM_Rhsim04G0043300 [Rhododendron simsii]|uniref:Anticodon-binding domain-containing protein n=1 Tax=Rhododendron simsii TaxID=118357 RepID=A0A834LSL3_RHOSS|nr:hypothetical protein RHSIM_Rhsim04G0043300 [Rhododendron simsii]
MPDCWDGDDTGRLQDPHKETSGTLELKHSDVACESDDWKNDVVNRGLHRESKLHLSPKVSSGASLDYCKEVTSKLKASGIRVEVCSGEHLPKLIRNAEKQKIPLMAVVGPKEVETQTVTVRSRFSGELGTITIDDFIGICKKAVENRTSV